MNPGCKITVFLIAILVFTPLVVHTFGKGISSQEEKIWKLENKYFESWKQEDIEGIISIYHDNFVGWPTSSDLPAGKESARTFAEGTLDQLEIIEFAIDPQAIKITGNLAVVHHFFSWSARDAEGKLIKYRQRVTHTWLNEDGVWKIIGGMSAD